MNYRQIICKYFLWLREQDPERGWRFEYKIRCLDTPFGYIGARGDRTVRDLIKDGVLEAEMSGKYRVVRYKMAPVRIPARVVLAPSAYSESVQAGMF